jgi:hypothetical protein
MQHQLRFVKGKPHHAVEIHEPSQIRSSDFLMSETRHKKNVIASHRRTLTVGIQNTSSWGLTPDFKLNLALK